MSGMDTFIHYMSCQKSNIIAVLQNCVIVEKNNNYTCYTYEYIDKYYTKDEIGYCEIDYLRAKEETRCDDEYQPYGGAFSSKDDYYHWKEGSSFFR